MSALPIARETALFFAEKTQLKLEICVNSLNSAQKITQCVNFQQNCDFKPNKAADFKVAGKFNISAAENHKNYPIEYILPLPT